jgi:hypothetical protein
MKYSLAQSVFFNPIPGGEKFADLGGNFLTRAGPFSLQPLKPFVPTLQFGLFAKSDGNSRKSLFLRVGKLGHCLFANPGDDSRELNGRRTIQFVGGDGKRRSIHLGKCSQRLAEMVRVTACHSKMSQLVIARHPLYPSPSPLRRV